MNKGLVIGKFMPLHKGHIALIAFAASKCDELKVVLCYTQEEPISGPLRMEWLEATFGSQPHIHLVPFLYNENELPNTSEPSVQVSRVWASALLQLFTDISMVFSSEAYGSYLAGFMHAVHMPFDNERFTWNVSATQIRKQPFRYWDYISDAAKNYFVKKIVLLGSESTGKSVLTERLAAYFNTAFVNEMARDIIEHTMECTAAHLQQIAEAHAEEIRKKMGMANKLLFIDTDINITKSYSGYLFNQEMETSSWIEAINKADLYFFLETDGEYVQDGTRLPLDERNALSLHHKKTLDQNGIAYIRVSGNWEERFRTMKQVIENNFLR